MFSLANRHPSVGTERFNIDREIQPVPRIPTEAALRRVAALAQRRERLRFRYELQGKQIGVFQDEPQANGRLCDVG